MDDFQAEVLVLVVVRRDRMEAFQSRQDNKMNILNAALRQEDIRHCR